VRKFDDSTYAISMDDDIYRAYHSDFAGLPLVSVQDLNTDDRKYCLYTWRFSADGAQLTLQRVSTKVVPDTTKTSAAIQQLIKQNLANPKLFDHEIQFTRKKRSGF
jgi:hypothetical protein